MANSNTTYILPSTVLYPVGCMGLRSLLLYILLYCPARHWHWSGRLVTMSTDCQWTITSIKLQFFPLFICSASCVMASVVVSFWAIFGLISITQFSLTDCYINTHSARNVGMENTHRSVLAFLRWRERKKLPRSVLGRFVHAVLEIWPHHSFCCLTILHRSIQSWLY